MFSNTQTPKWLKLAEKYLGWLAIPHIAVLFVTLQALGFLMVMADPVWIMRLALIPDAVRAGEFWRVITFLALPLSQSPIWVIFTLWFLYFIINMIENEWGAFKTTLYVLVSIIVTIAFSFTFNYPITDVSRFESTLFLAAASLFPEMEISLFMVLPVKIKWLAYLALAMLAIEFIRTDWLDRLFILAIYSNYLIFFGPALISQVRQAVRRRAYLNKIRK
jgi:membrane associated rhomboid family serine protease